MFLGEKLHFCLENKTCDPLNIIMDHSKFIASIQKEEFISSFKSSANYFINSKVWISCIWWNTKSYEFRAAVNHWIVFTESHGSFLLKAHLLWKVSMKYIFSN